MRAVANRGTGPLRICLHIGKPRTGTTSFQRAMAASRDRLKANGVCYPTTLGDDPRHMQLFWAAAGRERLNTLRRWHLANYDGQRLDERIDRTIAEAQDAETTLLSSEWFSMTFGPETFQPLVRQLGTYGRVTVHVTLRHQADAIISSWVRQVTDRARIGPLSSMTAVKGDWGRTDQPMNHLALLRGWSRFSEVMAIPYGPRAPDGLAATMGISGITFDQDVPSPPLSLCEFLRRQAPSFDDRARWKAFVAEVAAEPHRFAEHRDGEILKHATRLRDTFTRSYERSNRLLAEEFGCLLEPRAVDDC